MYSRDVAGRLAAWVDRSARWGQVLFGWQMGDDLPPVVDCRLQLSAHPAAENKAGPGEGGGGGVRAEALSTTQPQRGPYNCFGLNLFRCGAPCELCFGTRVRTDIFASF